MKFILKLLPLLALVRLVPADLPVKIQYDENPVKMTMDGYAQVNYTVLFNRSELPDLRTSDLIQLEFEPITVSPQFDIIEFNRTKGSKLFERVTVAQQDLKSWTYKSHLNLSATYIGHATLKVKVSLIRTDLGVNQTLGISESSEKLKITVIRHEGTLDKIFMYSVIVFITISYINLGAQIDTDNVRRLIETPKIILLGFVIGVAVMPTASWLAGYVFFKEQPMYRIGSFIYACGPAASASVLWTVMFDADKELSLGLQIASTVGALFIMPILLYSLDKSMDLEGQYTIKVPYMNLARTLVVLLIALLIGSRIVGSSKRAKQISQRVFRPLTMFVLLFIIVFSSIVYWYIYRMFDWTITAMALIVTSATYIFSGLLGYLIHRDIDQMITISISSTYRNSGIAFAALVVAFQPPDIFIAYVPCLTQVVSTSLIGLVLYCIKSLRANKRS